MVLELDEFAIFLQAFVGVQYVIVTCDMTYIFG